MKKTYELVDEYSEDSVTYYVTLDTDADAKTIQDFIYECKNKFFDWDNGEIEDEELEDGCFACETECVIYKLQDKFDGETINTDGTLYY